MKFDCLELDKIIGFDWDIGNIDKNLNKHGLSHGIIEEIFFNEPLIIAKDFTHSQIECRCYALGHTFDDRLLFVVFTIRNNKIRAISARAISKKERLAYENYR